MEEIYITPNGLELTESELRQEYGDRFDEFVAQGLLKKNLSIRLSLLKGRL